jgi:hypothetical protein
MPVPLASSQRPACVGTAEALAKPARRVPVLLFGAEGLDLAPAATGLDLSVTLGFNPGSQIAKPYRDLTLVTGGFQGVGA